MPPAAGLPIRLRPGLSRRRSSACAAARPGAPAGHRSRRAGLRWRSRAPSAAAGAQARPHARTIPTTEKAGGRPQSLAGGGRRGGRRHLYATLAQQVLLLLDVLLRLGPGRRFGAKAPRHQPEASSACPRGQGPPPAAGGPVPGPDGGLGNNGDDRGHPFGHPRGPGPVQNGHQGHPPQLVPLSSRAIPSLSPRRHACAKLPGCRHPDAAARRGARAPMPRSGRIRASAPPLICSSGISCRAAGPVSPPAPRAEVPAPATQARTLVIPSTRSSTWLVRRFRQLEK